MWEGRWQFEFCKLWSILSLILLIVISSYLMGHKLQTSPTMYHTLQRGPCTTSCRKPVQVGLVAGSSDAPRFAESTRLASAFQGRAMYHDSQEWSRDSSDVRMQKLSV